MQSLRLVVKTMAKGATMRVVDHQHPASQHHSITQTEKCSDDDRATLEFQNIKQLAISHNQKKKDFSGSVPIV